VKVVNIFKSNCLLIIVLTDEAESIIIYSCITEAAERLFVMENRKNVDEQGNVLYLDEERLQRKKMPFRKFENYSNGIGIMNFCKEHFSARPWNWKIVQLLFRIIDHCAPWLQKNDLKMKFFKRVMLFEPQEKMNSSGITMPLNVDLTDTAEKVVVPMDLIKDALKNASFIAGLNTCLCRDSKSCENYPHDIACMFIGEGGRGIVRHGLAREFTYEEACERLDKAAEAGLVAQSLWVEIEQLVWGFRNDNMDSFLEICFCCPCCCVAMSLSRNAPEELRKRFHPVGWTAVVDKTKCIGCRKCLETKCIQQALSFDSNGKLTVNDEMCVGCGVCKTKCPNGAIAIKQTMPMRENIREYFSEEFNIELKY